MARPATIVTRPVVGAVPLQSEGAGYTFGPRPGSYVNQYAQPLAIGTIYLFTDGQLPQVTYVSADGKITASTTLLAFVLDFIKPFYSAAYNPANVNAPTNAELTTTILAALGPFATSTSTYGQPPGWTWTVSSGSL